MRADWIDTAMPVHLHEQPIRGCTHTTRLHLRDVKPGTQGCAECLQTGSDWVHLRVCMECGHVGCCDDSPNQHATKHFHATRHPIMRSIQPGETWGWCYADEVQLGN